MEILSYSAMITGIVAAVLVSANLGAKITGRAFIIFTLSSILWIAVGLMDDKPPLWIQNIVLTCVNIFGVYRWLYVKAET